MVELKNQKYGVDRIGGKIRVAACIGKKNDCRAESLVSYPDSQLGEESKISGADLIFSIPENNAIIKKVKILDNKAIDPDQQAQFELAATLLDGEDRYYLESQALNGNTERLSVAYNKGMIDERLEYYARHLTRPSGFKLRSLAMAKAYRYFCRPEGGKLVCLVDINGEHASYCFLKDGFPSIIGSVEGKNGGIVGEPFMIDLSATLLYRQSGDPDGTGGAPLSRIIISGESADWKLAELLEKYTHVKVSIPYLKQERFLNDTQSEAAKYMVSLGLAIDD